MLKEIIYDILIQLFGTVAGWIIIGLLSVVVFGIVLLVKYL